MDIFDPLSQEMLEDPHRVYRQLRSEDPVHWSSRLDAWVLTRHPDCFQAIQDTDRFASDFRRIGEETPAEILSIQTIDPPQHKAHQQALIEAMRGHDFRAWTAEVGQYARALLCDLDSECFDLVQDFAEPVVAAAMSALFGVELAGDPARYRTAQRDLVLSMDGGLAPERLPAGLRARSYLSGLIDPDVSLNDYQKGLLSRIDFTSAGEDLPYLVNSVRAIFVAGHSSGGSMLINAVHTLLDAGLLAGRTPPHLGNTGFNELVRYCGPVQGTSRAVLADTTIGGQRVRRGDVAVAVLASANRDPAVFEDAESLLLDRADNPHLGFGAGIHACLGTRLAQRLGVEVIGVLAGSYRVEAAGDAIQRPSATVRSLDHLPVRLERRRPAHA